MSILTIALYIAAFGLWVWLIRADGGIGIGIRFLYGCNVVLFFLIGPLLGEVVGLTSQRNQSPYYESAVKLSLYGFIAYIVGGYIAFPRLAARRANLVPHNYVARMTDPARLSAQWGVAWTLIALGLLSLPFYAMVRFIPTVGAAFTQLPRMMDTGLVMLCLFAHYSRRWPVLAIAFGVLLGKGIVFSAMSGHAGWLFLNGMFMACVAVLSSRLRATRVIALAAFGIIAFIPAQMWLTNRDKLRDAIKHGHGFEERARIVVNIFFESQSLEAENTDIVASYRFRGDYSDLLADGLAHTPAKQPFAMGDTFVEAFTAIIPRALWPDKPYHAGGNEFVSRYTGRRFNLTTSVGMNYLFELYVNFGHAGVFVGMFGLGMLLGWIESLYYRRGVRDLFYEFCLVHSAWAICLYCDTFAMLVMTAIPGIVLCLLIRSFMLGAMQSPYLPMWNQSPRKHE